MLHTRLRSPLPTIAVLVAIMQGPRSFTGEDVVEMQLPGNPALLERVLQQTMQTKPSACLAEPGEFTFRAFTTGRIDLTQAEGIAATIAAISDAQLRAAGQLRQGKLGTFAQTLVDRLSTHLALVEAGIDFIDQEDVVPITPAALLTELTDLHRQLTDLQTRSRSWGELQALPRIVLAGPPSAGKSTLFNALLGRTRAVIDVMPGTTRDVLAEPLRLTDKRREDVEVMLVDIAGLEAVDNSLRANLVDQSAQAAAQHELQRADLVLLLEDVASSDVPIWKFDASSIFANVLRIIPKADAWTNMPQNRAPSQSLVVSAHTGEGLDALRQAMLDALGERAASLSGDRLALQPRHEHCLAQAEESLAEAIRLLEPYCDAPALVDMELIAGRLRESLDALADLGGKMTPDDVIGKVFSTFCVGK